MPKILSTKSWLDDKAIWEISCTASVVPILQLLPFSNKSFTVNCVSQEPYSSIYKLTCLLKDCFVLVSSKSLNNKAAVKVANAFVEDVKLIFNKNW